MKIAQQWTYSAPVDRVWEMVSDPRFQEERGTAAGALEQEVTVRPQDGGAVVAARRRLPTRGVPGPLQRFVGDGLSITETQTWRAPSADGSRDGTLEVSVAGMPVTLRGTLRMAPDAVGTRMSVDGDLSASVPLLGGQIEKAAAPGMEAAVRSERTVGERYLAG